MRTIVNWKPNMKTIAFVMTMLITMLLSGVASGQQKPTRDYARVNGLICYSITDRRRVGLEKSRPALTKTEEKMP